MSLKISGAIPLRTGTSQTGAAGKQKRKICVCVEGDVSLLCTDMILQED